MAQVERATSNRGKQYLTQVLSNLQFQSNVNATGEFAFVGWESDLGGDFLVRKLIINVDIPDNFVILEARITYVNIPINWYQDPDYFWGYVRNLTAYKMTNFSTNYSIQADAGGGFQLEGGAVYSAITSAFGATGYTPSEPTDLDYKVETIISDDIKNSLEAGSSRIVLQPTTKPTTTGDPIDDLILAAEETSAGHAVLNVIGYVK